MSAEDVLAAYSAGAISAEIALMRLLLATGNLAAFEHRLAAPEFAPLAAAATAHREGLRRAAVLIEAGLAADRHGIAAIREQFDRAVALAPEASVALYSLDAPEILSRATEELVERLREWRLVGPDVAVLDIGCGIGRVELALAGEVAQITGIDVSPNMIAEARRRCAHLPNANFACCGGADLAEFAGCSFGLVLAVDSFPYLVAAGAAIAARHIADAARLLRAGGALAIFNYSYRGDLEADCDDLAVAATRHLLTLERNGTRDFTLWDGVTFLLRKPG